MFTLEDLDFLASDHGVRVLERLAHEDVSDSRKIRIVTALRKELTMTQAAAALETAILRKKAVDKFGDDAAKMYFTREALEQASDPLIRDYRKRLLWKDSAISDVCCSIGSDALALADRAADVLGLDIDPVRIRMAKMNAAALNLKNVRFEVADVRQGIQGADFVFYDPARRDDDGKRLMDVEKYEPPLSLIKSLQNVSRIMVKLSPGVQLDQLANYDGCVEFISVDGQLKEALLLLGFDSPTISVGTAAVLFHNKELHRIWISPKSRKNVEISSPRSWLCEPDPSILRAGFVQDIAATLGGTMLDETIAYFTTSDKPTGEWAVWVRAWKILDWMPFNLKKLISYLRAEGVGHITIKKRGVPMTPDELLPKMKLEGDASRTLVLTRHNGEMIVMICEDYQPN